MLKFIDISNWQANMNLANVASQIDGVIVKATEGIGFVDKSCDKFYQQAKKLGLERGFYHFARNNNATKEADFFYQNTKNYFYDGIPVLDWEAGQSIAWVNEFVQRIYDLTGVWCLVYGNAWRFNQGTVNTNCGRWLAGYPSNNITSINYGINNDCPYKTNGLTCAWQFSSSVKLSGYSGSLDGDVFYGDVTAWRKYAGQQNADTKPSKPAEQKPAEKPSKPSVTQITVDGYWGKNTTKRLQQVLGTTADGEVWHQWAGNKQPAFTTGWQYDKTQKGSPVIKAMQKKLGVPADGIIGKNTINALIKHYAKTSGAKADGKLDAKSITVKAMQKALNANKF